MLNKLKAFAESSLSAARTAYLAREAFRFQELGREGELGFALHAARQALEKNPSLWMPKAKHQNLRVGLLTVAGLNETYRYGSRALIRADELSATETQIGLASAASVRMVHHLCRGQSEEAEPHRSVADSAELHGKLRAQLDRFVVPAEAIVAVVWMDRVALRRALTRLDSLVVDDRSLRPLRDGLSVAHAVICGDATKAVRLGNAFLRRHSPRSFAGWGPIYASIVAASIHAGDVRRGLAIAEGAMSFLSEADREYVVMYSSLEAAYAVALMGCGELDAGKALLEQMQARLQEAGGSALYERCCGLSRAMNIAAVAG